jgi:hypothetical protein
MKNRDLAYRLAVLVMLVIALGLILTLILR